VFTCIFWGLIRAQNSFSSLCTFYTPPSQGQKPPARSPEPICVPGLPADCVHNAYCQWPVLLASVLPPLTTSLSDLLFGDVPIVLWVLTHIVGCLVVPTVHNVFLTVLAKAMLPPRVIATLTNYHKGSRHHACLSHWGTYARPYGQQWGQRKWKWRHTEPAEFLRASMLTMTAQDYLQWRTFGGRWSLFTMVAFLHTDAAFCCKLHFHLFAQAPCVDRFCHRELLLPKQDTSGKPLVYFLVLFGTFWWFFMVFL